MFKKLLRHFYNWKVEVDINGIDFPCWIKILEEYNSVSNPNVEEIESIFEADDFIAYKDKNSEIYDIFFKDLHLQYVDKPTDKMISISIKKKDEKWIISEGHKTYDFTNMVNTSMEVYYRFKTLVKNRETMECEKHIRGEWDKSLSKELLGLGEQIQALTLFSKFNKEYSKKKVETPNNFLTAKTTLTKVYNN